MIHCCIFRKLYQVLQIESVFPLLCFVSVGCCTSGNSQAWSFRFLLQLRIDEYKDPAYYSYNACSHTPIAVLPGARALFASHSVQCCGTLQPEL